MNEDIHLSTIETNQRTFNIEMSRLDFLFKRSHWPHDYNIGLPCCLGEDSGCEGLYLGDSSEDRKKRMDLESAVKQTLQGWLRESMWEMQEKEKSRVTSRCSGLTTHQVADRLLRQERLRLLQVRGV